MSGRHRFPTFAVACLLLFAAGASRAADSRLHHDLGVRLEPTLHTVFVEDRLTIPVDLLGEPDGGFRFALHGALEVQATVPGFELEKLPGEPDLRRYGINEDAPGAPEVPLVEYVLRPIEIPQGADAVTAELTFGGEIHHPIVAEGEEYARSFSRTPGIVDEQGVVLSGSTWWLPALGNHLVTFRMTVDVPEGWEAVSQGTRTGHEIARGRRLATWDSPEPMDEVYLIAARFTEYSRPAGNVMAYAFLREPDPNLAAKYLETTAQYLEMYRELIGPYPYGKFALVENFWETGYGMPSFTLLGPKIIRFPFILHSSYPHEILHNWWGNSVFVDYPSGNWCEGLTAYLADHLIKEGQGRGDEYRRDTLKKYRNFVRGEKDFPLTEFRSRHSSATEAVGYGKSLMAWHMLRQQLGDAVFADGLRRFYRANRGKRAGFGDLETAFSAVSGADLREFFGQWVERTGAPQLELEEVATQAAPGGAAVLTLVLRQIHQGEPYRLRVPVEVTLEGRHEPFTTVLELTDKRQQFRIELPAPAARVDVDPQFDLFRRLDPFEIPASLGQLFGAEQVTLVLPDQDDAVGREAWENLARGWAEENGAGLRLVEAAAIDRLPSDRAVWILGSQNRWADGVRSALGRFDAEVSADELRAGQEAFSRQGLSFAFAVRHPDDPDLALGWIGADRAAALPGLARKLPHYGKYSYVAFEGDEPANVAKGQWPVLGSPLVRFLGAATVARAELPPREPLAELAPVFDPERLMAHVRHLASADLEGRGVGTEGLDRAAEYVAKVFEEAGLEPGGDDGSWFQRWSEPGGPDDRPVTLRNVVGVLPGRREGWAEQSVVLGAHYDHLGRGWPEVRAGNEGQVHPGADDNASGVAVLLELARLLGGELEPDRSVLFVAFAGEEWGLRGSRHYVEAMRRWPASKAIAMVNLDTVGRLGDQKITVFGTGSASEWIHIVRGIGFTTGVEATAVADDLGGSDQRSFLEAGIPAVQVFTGAHEDYHRPSDSAAAIDDAGLVKVAVFTREMVVYLSEREEPLSSTLAAAPTSSPAAAPPAAAGGRRVSLGTLPDFAFPGPGVRVEQVMPGTPAAAAGLQPGDLIVAIDGEEVADVRGYADILRARSPGDTIRIEIRRDGTPIALEATLVER